MSNDVKNEVSMCIKNRVDISKLIAPYSINGENFTNAIISNFQRSGEDISRLNLTNATIGVDNGETNISRAIVRNCCFKNTRFLGKVVAKKTDFTNTSFEDAFIPICDYRFADLRGCTFCGTAFTIGTHYSLGAKFDDKFFKDLAKMWNLTITVNKEITEVLLEN